MIVDFSHINYKEPMLLILKNATEDTLGILGYAKNRKLDLQYNPVSTLSFELPAKVDGEDTPFYGDVVGMRIIEIPNIGQFIINNPEESGDGVHREKRVEAYSLEYEFARKKITLGEGTYRFYDAGGGESLLGMIMELMPAWTVGTVPAAIASRYRTFSVDNGNLYDLMMNTIQDTYGCIFEFNTLTRTVNVRDISAEPSQRAVWLSDKNLAKEIEIKEETDNIYTRLDVNGADGVNIRDVNPDGTNKIVNLDYFMTTDNFSQELITKYNAWKTLYAANKESYYNLTVRYTLCLMRKVTEQANLTDLNGEVANLDNQRAVTIQAIAQGLQTQSALDTINASLVQAQAAADAKQAEIDDIDDELADIMDDLTTIKNACNFRGYFTDAEWLKIDRYIRDGDVTESTFAAETTGAYMDEGKGNAVDNAAVALEDGEFNSVTDASGRKIITMRGGTLTVGTGFEANVVTCTLTKEPNSAKTTLTAQLADGEYSTEYFPSGCVTLTGDSGTITESTDVTFDFDGYMYFTYDVSEYQRRSVAWDLFEYGEQTLASLAFPSYTFSVNSANFIALEDYIAFRDALRLGERIYLEKDDNHIVRPILTGATINLDEPSELSLGFSDKYSGKDPAQKLVDLLGQTVSMSKSVDAGKYTYSAFKDSGAETGIKTRMTSALDVARNQIINSSGQASSWDASGLHLRKWTNAQQTAYDDEQIWMNNNMIAMTDDGWETAKIAIGKFRDANAGDCWGIVAPMIMGTILAGASLIIESEKTSGPNNDIAVFKMDEDGCRLYNSDFTVSRITESGGVTKTAMISINPDFGIAIGDGQLYSVDAQTGAKTLNTSHANFYADNDGNVFLTGAVTATSLYIRNNGTDTSIDNYINLVVDDQHIAAVVGSTYAYLKTTGIELSSAGSIVIKNNNDTSLVTVDASGVSLAGTTISLASGTASVSVGATGISLASGNSNVVTIGQDGIDMQSGKFSVTADSDDSVIRFGGTAQDPNFSLGLGGDIVANNAIFNSVSVTNGSLVTAPPGSVAPSIIIADTQPTGRNILWFQPSSVSSVSYVKNAGGFNPMNGVSQTLTKSGSSFLTGDSMKCGIRFHIYIYNGKTTNTTLQVDVRPANSSAAWQTILNHNYGSYNNGDGLWIDTTLDPVTLSNINWTSNTQLEVRFSGSKGGTGVVQTKGDITLECSNNSTQTDQLCTVHYLI